MKALTGLPSCPQIARFFGVCFDYCIRGKDEQECPLLVFEFIEGKTLMETCQRGSPARKVFFSDTQKPLRVLRDVAKGLKFMHDTDYVHRDIHAGEAAFICCIDVVCRKHPC